MEASKTFQLHHTYDLDGGDEPVTVIARTDTYVMFCDAENPYRTSIYPMEIDGDYEALLLPCPMLNEDDFDGDGTPLPYWSPVCDCEDVTGQYPWED